MGQYYTPIILANPTPNNKEVILAFMESWVYNYGNKISEHFDLNSEFVKTFEYQLSPEGRYYNSRVVWAGDYADEEKGCDYNLNSLTEYLQQNTKLIKPLISDSSLFPYIVNHSKKLFVNKNSYIIKNNRIHPLPILTAEGNGNSGTDYKGTEEHLVGTWARDYISLEKEELDIPRDYNELVCNFRYVGYDYSNEDEELSEDEDEELSEHEYEEQDYDY